jgi:hypothetical protein
MSFCIGEFLGSISNNGVNPNAYDDFVEATVNYITLSDQSISSGYADAVTTTSSFIMILVLTLIFIVFAIVIILLVYQKYISIISGIAIIFIALVIATLYLVVSRSFIQSMAADYGRMFQNDILKTSLYTINSVLRDTLYLWICN